MTTLFPLYILYLCSYFRYDLMHDLLLFKENRMFLLKLPLVMIFGLLFWTVFFILALLIRTINFFFGHSINENLFGVKIEYSNNQVGLFKNVYELTRNAGRKLGKWSGSEWKN